ncbi:endolytic transglycosylase MltG [Steroidobacter sp. S1-65]|uniref:Endolytic murein transglycosylase n=1 Tax=Steroidobacter gossypii TaxID=2805490 RepID=A0ABS1WX67_9GAMM|nr:endolytic transglycosylase MltG [Steroidobacter gossypii]MBM0105579.1 endolytic transglycosylase MltG [Steroidobacter gossypii]
MRTLLRLFGVLIVLGAIALGALAWWGHRWLQTPIATLTEPTVFEVPKGASLRTVASSLNDQNLLDQPQIWTAWARITKRAHSLKAGEYQLTPGLTPSDLLERLNSGQVLLHSITFIEGSTFADIRKALAQSPSVRNEYGARTPEEVMRALGQPDVHPEGQFFPDTYRFPRNTTDIELLGMAFRRMQQELTTAWESRAKDLPLSGPYEALILASIVEKETALDSERAQIAGVFIERLRRGMRLQTDPTVIYGMMATYDGNIRRKDLLRDTPYNTYTRAGLPPTPIALPGLESLRAAVQPETTGALFFVATGKGDGSHYFSRTLSEHNAAVKRYLKTLRK